MKFPQALRRTTIATLCCTAFGTFGLSGAAFGADAEVMAKIEAMQREIEALKAQIKSQPASSGGSSASGPAGFEMSVYGVGHLSGDRIDNGTTSSSYLHSSSSRLGFRGSQDLGGGTAVIFQYETGVDVTNNGTGDGNPGGSSLGGGALFTGARDTFVGLKGNFGAVTLGRQSAIEQWLYDYNLFGDQVGDLGNIWGDLPGRFNNSIKYAMPGMGGLNLALTYAPKQGTNDADSFLAKADFGTGGFKVGAAYGNFGRGALTGPAFDDNRVGALTASYSTSQFSVGGGFQHESDVGNVSGADQNKYTLGASVNVGSSGTLKVQYARGDDIGDVGNTGVKQWAIGYDHAWRKDTTVYVAYAKTTNDALSSNIAYNWGHGTNGVPATAPGTDPAAFSIGLVYKFDAAIVGKR